MEEIKVIVHLKESELNNLVDALDFCVSNHCYYYDLLLKFERVQEKLKIAKEKAMKGVKIDEET